MTIKRTKILTATALLAAGGIGLGSCVPKSDNVPTPPPTTSRPTTPTTPPPPPTASKNWQDQPRTPGTWVYRPGTAASLATYGNPGRDPVFAVECDRRSRVVSLLRADSARKPVAMRVLTENSNKVLTAEPARTGYPAVAARLNGNDPLLDAMAFSKGRFAVEVAGTATVYVPSWTEFSRVVEDCR